MNYQQKYLGLHVTPENPVYEGILVILFYCGMLIIFRSDCMRSVIGKVKSYGKH